MSDHKPPSLNWVEDHYKLIQELYQTELSTNAPTATINNPAWFKHIQGALIATERGEIYTFVYMKLCLQAISLPSKPLQRSCWQGLQGLVNQPV